MEKVSLITTVKNEQSSIKQFIESIARQTKKPDEIIIVDGGSKDNTLEILKKYEVKIKNLRVVIEHGNRSKGRNVAIKLSSNQIIAATDAGCVLDTRWLERLSKPFQNKDVDVVAGYYKPKFNTVFQKCLATYTCVMQDRVNPYDFLPSSRSIAFRKSAWRKVKGYPEYLDTCEDLVFARNARDAGLQFVTVLNAFVLWPQRKNILQAAKQFFSYAKGDGRARYFRKTTPLLFGRYVFGITVLVYAIATVNYLLLIICCLLFFLYLLWSVCKNYKYVKRWQAFLYLPILQIVSDACVISGTILGLFQNIWVTQNRQ